MELLYYFDLSGGLGTQDIKHTGVTIAAVRRSCEGPGTYDERSGDWDGFGAAGAPNLGEGPIFSGGTTCLERQEPPGQGTGTKIAVRRPPSGHGTASKVETVQYFDFQL